MKIVAINGSPRANGNTAHALECMAEELHSEGIGVEMVQVGDKLIHGRIACGYCWTSEGNYCVFKDDIVNETCKKTSVAAVRRAGGVDVVHQLNNYLNLAETVLPPSQYWTIVYGMDPGEAAGDGEGIQTVRKNARAMAWLLKALDAAKQTVPFPKEEERVFTNFIR